MRKHLKMLILVAISAYVVGVNKMLVSIIKRGVSSKIMRDEDPYSSTCTETSKRQNRKKAGDREGDHESRE